MLELRIDRLEAAADHREILDLDLVGALSDEPLAIAGRIGSLTGLINTSEVEHDLEVRLAGARFSTSGTIQDLGALTGVDTEVTARGPRLEEVLAVVGLEASIGGPFQLAATIDPTSTGSAVELEAAAGEFIADIAGEVDSLTRPRSLDLEITASAPDAAAVAALAGLDGVPGGRLEISGHAAWAGFPLRFDDLRIRVGDNTIAAHGLLGAPPRMPDTDFRFEGEGPDVSGVAALAGLQLPAESYRVRGRLVRVEEGVRAEDIEARLGRSELRVDGFIGDPPGFDGTALSFHAEGPSLRPYQRHAGVDLPRGQFVVDGRLAEAQQAIRLENVTGTVGDITAAVEGTVRVEGGLAGSELRLTAAGSDARSLAEVIRLDGLPAVPWQVEGSATLQTGGVRLQDADARLGTIRLQGDGTVATAPGLVGTDLELRIDLPNLAHASNLAGLTGLPDEPLEISGRVRVTNDGYLLEAVRAKSREITATIDGMVGVLPELEGSDLELSASGAGLERWSGFAGVRLPDDQFEVQGRLRIDGPAYELEGVTLSFAGARAAIDGAVRPAAGLVGTDVRIELAGDELRRVGGTIAAISGFAVPELPAQPFTLVTSLQVEDDGFQIDGLRASVGAAEAEADGSLGRPPGFIGTDLRLRGDGPDAALFTGLTGVSMPVAPFQFSGSIRRDGAGFGFDHLELQLGDYWARLHGTMGEPPTLIGTDLEIHASGPDTNLYEALAGLPDLPDKPFALDGRLSGTPERFSTRDFKLTFGRSDIQGFFTVDMTDKPAVEARLDSQVLDLSYLGERLGAVEDATQSTPPGAGDAHKEKGALLFPDEAMHLGWLQAADANVEIRVDQLYLRAVEFRDLAADVHLEDGRLKIERVAAAGRGEGRMTGSLLLEPRHEKYRFETDISLRQIRLDPPDSVTQLLQRPPIDIDIDLEAVGATPHELASSTNGAAQLVVGTGIFDSSVLDLVTADILLTLLNALNPFAEEDPTTELQCGVALLIISDGIAKLEPMAFQSDKMTLLGEGKTDLETEKLNFRWVTKPR
ncbi:MAG: AsmA-like C-terminal region-containing protein, partial [Acidobacteriota bacterium]